MKTKNLLFALLISLFACLQSNQIKADTIYVQMPGGMMHLCQDGGFDTLLFYKPIGFELTKWNISGGW